MIIDDTNVAEFTSGRKFHNAATIKLQFENGVGIRNDIIVALTNGKSVLHAGCADHIPLIEKKIASGRYLHSLLSQCSSLVGYDISRPGVAEMERLGFRDVYYDERELRKAHPNPFDFLVLSDVIEHLPNPSQVLINLLKFDFRQAIISTPNAMRLTNRIRMNEEINTDHVQWYSPYTLQATLDRAGYDVVQRFYTDFRYKKNVFRVISKSLFPAASDGLLYVCKKKINPPREVAALRDET